MRRLGLVAACVILASAACGCNNEESEVEEGNDVVDASLDPDVVADVAAEDVGEVSDGVAPIDGATLDSEEGDATTGGDADVEDEPGQFGAPCSSNGDCEDSYCVEGQIGFICTKTCVIDCPDGFNCKLLSTGGADNTFLCLPDVEKLCTPCAGDISCGGGRCLQIDGIGQCASGCTDDEECPDGFGCLANPDNAADPASWCQPKTGSCTCVAGVDGGQRT
ncbi:MAG: hypothetical protein ACI9OJ_001774, partial [Myxococcota bacterium]